MLPVTRVGYKSLGVNSGVALVASTSVTVSFRAIWWLQVKPQLKVHTGGEAKVTEVRAAMSVFAIRSGDITQSMISAYVGLTLILVVPVPPNFAMSVEESRVSGGMDTSAGPLEVATRI